MTGSTTAAPRPLRGLRVGAMMALALLVSALVLLIPSHPAHAASRVDVAPAPNANGETTVTLSGSGFQYLPNAPGGVYVFFGAVVDPSTNSWAPSQGGKSGQTFSYASTGGSQLLVGFAGGSSAEASNSLIDASGSWTAQMTIPGSSFVSTSGDPHSGSAQTGATIDCMRVQCGIITIGAHGMVNANNESFTPISFVTSDGSLQSGTGGQSFTDDATVLDIPVGEGEEPEEPVAAGGGERTATNAETDDEGFDSTWIVIGVLGVALAVLVAAIVVVAVKRGRPGRGVAAEPAVAAAPAEEQSAAPPAGRTAAPGAEQITEAEGMDER